MSLKKAIYLSQSPVDFVDINSGEQVKYTQYNFISINEKGEKDLTLKEATKAIIDGLISGKIYELVYLTNEKTAKETLVGALLA